MNTGWPEEKTAVHFLPHVVKRQNECWETLVFYCQLIFISIWNIWLKNCNFYTQLYGLSCGGLLVWSLVRPICKKGWIFHDICIYLLASWTGTLWRGNTVIQNRAPLWYKVSLLLVEKLKNFLIIFYHKKLVSPLKPILAFLHVLKNIGS